MPSLQTVRALLLGVVVVGASSVALPAQAVLRIQAQNAAGVCQGALPVYDTSLRNRPSAVANEGTTSAFVSCSMEGDNASSEAPTLFGAIFRNNTAGDKTINCTFVDGTGALGPLTLISKASAPIPEGSLGEIVWDPATDNGGTPFSAFNNVSCNLPAGVEIQIVVRHVEDGSASAAP